VLTLTDAATFVAAMLALAAAGALMVRGRRPRRPPQRFFIAALVALAIETALGAPLSSRIAFSHEPIPHVVRVTVAELAMVGSFCLLGVALFASIPASKAKRNVIAHAVILAVCAVAAPLSLYGSGAPPSPVRALATPSIGVTTFVLIRIIYTGATTVVFAVRAFRAIRLPETNSEIRTGFRMALAASLIACFHGMWTLAIAFRFVASPISQDVAALYLAVALALLSAGATVTIWGSAVRTIRIRLMIRSLVRLWNDLADLRRIFDITVRPTVSLRSADRAEELLTHYIVGLGDLQRAARPYVHPEVRTWSAEIAAEWGLTQAAEATVTTATELATALDAVRAGRDPVTPSATTRLFDRRVHARRRTDSPTSRQAQPDALAEARRLAVVGYAFRHSPAVQELRRRGAEPAMIEGPDAACVV
jgi:hypothetical protein